MKCLCSLDNGYEVIGLCNIDEFNKKINDLDSNAWNKLIIAENLSLSENNPPIEKIRKAYVHIEITNYKLINTPISNEPNIEGLKLTGKMLSLSGIIRENIIYKSLDPKNKMNSIKSDIPFNSYIILDSSTNINKDKFCVYPCIENVSLNLLDKKNINNNISLFLFTYKVEMPKEYLPNDIIFRNDENEEMIKIRFDSTNKVFVTKATDNIEESNFGDTFEFALYNADGTNKKLEGQIIEDETAKNLASIFNNKPFEYDDIISFNFFYRANRVVITNYPNLGNEYNPVFLSSEAFKITPSGLVKHILKNKIILLDENDDEITSVNFSLLNNSIDTTYTGSRTPLTFSGENYFIATLKDLSGGTKFSEDIEGDKDAEVFQLSFIENFEFTDFIEVFCEEPNKVKITNFPLPSQTYTFTEKTEIFAITRKGLLKPINPIIGNRIFFKAKNSMEFVAGVLFDSVNKLLSVESYGIECGFEEEFQNQNFFEFTLKNNLDIVKKQGIIRANEDGENFKNDLNNTPFEYGNILKVKYKLNNRVLIVNFPSDGYDYERFWGFEESFRITKNGLTGLFNSLKSYIIVEAFDNTDAGIIKFNTDNLTIVADSTGKINRQGFPNEYFALLLKSSSGIVKYQISLTGDDSFDGFKDYFNGKNFKYGDTITLRTSSPVNVQIYNYPNISNLYRLKEKSADFRITQNGIIKL